MKVPHRRSQRYRRRHPVRRPARVRIHRDRPTGVSNDIYETVLDVSFTRLSRPNISSRLPAGRRGAIYEQNLDVEPIDLKPGDRVCGCRGIRARRGQTENARRGPVAPKATSSRSVQRPALQDINGAWPMPGSGVAPGTRPTRPSGQTWLLICCSCRHLLASLCRALVRYLRPSAAVKSGFRGYHVPDWTSQLLVS